MTQAITLDSEASYRAIEGAIRTQAQVIIKMTDSPEVSIQGFLVSGDNSALLTEITGRFPVNESRILDAPCDVMVSCDRRYHYSSRITAIPKWGDSRSLAIARPKIINVGERRRFFRARLAPSTRVDLEWKEAGEIHHFQADLFNISLDGLACRLDESAAMALSRHDSLYVSFHLPGRDELFRFCASVSNKTPASEGCTIVGVQFVRAHENQADLDSLQELLGGPAKCQVESKVSL